MWSSWLSGSTIPALEQSISFAQRRHMLLAGNIANLDTPDYQSRDLDVDNFQKQLLEAINSQQAAFHSPGSSGPSRPAIEMQEVRDASKQILYHDGSDVSLEHQVTEIAKNQGMHNAAIALMRSQFQTLQAAIRESASI